MIEIIVNISVVIIINTIIVIIICIFKIFPCIFSVMSTNDSQTPPEDSSFNDDKEMSIEQKSNSNVLIQSFSFRFM